MSTSTGQATMAANCGGAAYRPVTLIVQCDGHLTATQIQWTSWTSAQASGQAVISLLVCQPTCAAGHEELLPAAVMLSEPEVTSRGPEFSRLTVTWSGTEPDGRAVESYVLQTD